MFISFVEETFPILFLFSLSHKTRSLITAICDIKQFFSNFYLENNQRKCLALQGERNAILSENVARPVCFRAEFHEENLTYGDVFYS